MNNILFNHARVVIEGEEETIELTPFELYELKVNYTFNKIPYCEILLINSDREMTFSSKEVFTPSKTLTISVIDKEENTSVLFKGVIMNYGTLFRGGKCLTSIDLQNDLVKLTRGRRNHIFPLCLKSIVDEINGFHNIDLINSLEESSELEELKLLQYNLSDYDFLVSKVKELGGAIYSTPEEIKISPINISTETELTIYPYECSYFDVATSVRGVIEQINQFSYNIEDMTVGEEASEMIDLELGSSYIDSTGISSNLDNNQNIENSDYSKTSSECLKGKASQEVILSKLTKVQGVIGIAGNNTICSGDYITIEEAGDAVNGNAFVYGVEHTIQAGRWMTHLDLGFKYSSINSIKNKIDQTSFLGIHNGIVRGISTDESSDKYLIQVELPILMQSSEASPLVWARLASFYAGRNHGTLWLPEIEDEVIVSFMGGDSSNPVVLGSLFKNSDEHENIGIEGMKSIITNAGLQLNFDDINEIITIKTGTNQIVLDQINGTLTSEVLEGDTVISSIKMDAEGGINCTSNDGVITLEADVININGTSEVNIESSSSLNIDGQSLTVSSQANMELEASAMMKLKGTQIQLN